MPAQNTRVCFRIYSPAGCKKYKSAICMAVRSERRDISTPIKFRLEIGQGESMMRVKLWNAPMRMSLIVKTTSIYGYYMVKVI